eukprot:10618679-Karenia_brevis.AAC.1
MLANGGTPKGWHQRWTTTCKLTANDAHVATHEAMCHLLEFMISYDQLDAGALASAEIAARQVQLAEEKWKDR